MKKKFLRWITYIFVLAMMLPARVSAEGRNEFLLDGEGKVTLTSPQAAAENVSSFSFSLWVDAANGESVGFLFDESDAKVQEFRYDREKKQLNIYVAGTEALFENGTESLMVGRITVLDGSGNAAPASVSIVEDSFRYVSGTQLKTVEDLELPGTVRINEKPAQTPNPGQTPAPGQSPAPGQTPGTAQTPTPGQTPSAQTPAGNQTPSGQAPGTAQTPVPSQTQPAGQNPGTTPAGNSGGDSAAQPARTSGPSQSSGTTQTSRPSSAPEDNQPSEPADSANPGESSKPDNSDAVNKDDILFDPEMSGREEAEKSSSIDLTFVVAIGAILIFAGVVVMAIVVLVRKPDGFGENDRR